jgi:hypothetical protein
MKRLCLAIVALAFVIVAVPASVLAQDAAKSSGMAGKVTTNKKLADCKKQAKNQKLTFGKRRKFLRDCVKT